MVPNPLKIVLCSASPHRREMLRNLGIRFQSHISGICEEWDGILPPRQFVVRMAIDKTLAYKDKNALVIGMDTVVVVDNQILGKPVNARQAKRMLKTLRKKMHQVITGVAVCYKGKLRTDSESTRVYFRDLESTEIEWYVKTGEALDKAGAYAIQGLGRIFISRINGCYFNVVGFPITCFQRVLKRHGLTIFDLMR